MRIGGVELSELSIWGLASKGSPTYLSSKLILGYGLILRATSGERMSMNLQHFISKNLNQCSPFQMITSTALLGNHNVPWLFLEQASGQLDCARGHHVGDPL